MKRLTNIALAASLALWGCASAFAATPQVYGYQMGDSNYRFGFMQFPANDVGSITVTMSSDDSSVSAGEFVDGKYYAFTAYYDAYFEGGVVTDYFRVYNVSDDGKTYKATTEIDKYGEKRVIDMTFDYTNNTMYALAESKKADSGKIGTTELYIVDMSTGDLYLVGGPGDITAQDGYGRTVHENIVALAASPEGKLYGVGEYRQLYTLDKYTGLATAVGTRHKVAIDNDFQTLAFTPDGDLYHAHKHPDYEYFMQIDPANGTLKNPVTGENVEVYSDYTNNAARIPKDPQITGIYFKGFEIASAANKAPQNLKAVLKEGTSNTVELSWTLPTQTYKGNTATVSNVLVYRLGEAKPLATLSSDATSYTDTTAPDGDVVYYVTTTSGSTTGFPAIATLLAGADRLKAVGNLTATLEGMTVTLSWEAPTETVNGGYADFDNITYQAIAMSGSTPTEIASDIKETTCQYTLPKAGTYTFIVVPVSCGVGGLEATSNEIVVEKTSSIPYTTGFEDNEDGTLWTVINPVGGNYGWFIELPPYAYQRYDGKCAKFYTGGSSTLPADTWLVSPQIDMEAGVYTLKFMALGGSFDSHTFEVGIGTDATDGDSFNVVASYKEEMFYSEEEGHIQHFLPIELTFTIEETGAYFLGFHGIGNATYATLRIDNVELDKTGELAGSGLTLPYETGFEPEEDTPAWTYLNNEGADLSGYNRCGWWIEKQAGSSKAYEGDYFAHFKTASVVPLDAWMISPALYFDQAGEYELSFAANGTSFDTHTFDILLGTDAENADSFTQEIKKYSQAKLYGTSAAPYVIETVSFTVEEAGSYFIAFRGIGNATLASLKIDAFKVEKGEVEAAEGLKLPYSTGFEPEEENEWSYLNNDGAALAGYNRHGWWIEKQAGSTKAYEGDYFAQFKTAGSDTNPINAMMISPALKMEAGEYELVYAVGGTSYDTHTVKVTLGTDANDAESFKQELKSYEAEKVYDGSTDHHYIIETISFTVNQAGTYHIGLLGIGNDVYAPIKFDALEVAPKSTDAIGSIVDDAKDDDVNAPAVYYDLMGRQVAHPAAGRIYIVRQGGKVTKQLYR